MEDPPPASSLGLGGDEQPVKMPHCSPFNVEGAWEGSSENTLHIWMAKIKSCARGWKKTRGGVGMCRYQLVHGLGKVNNDTDADTS